MAYRARSLFLALPVIFAVACSSSSPDSSSTTTPPVALDGTYVLDDADSTADFDQITFIDSTRYMIDPTGCDNGDLCKKTGWYEVASDAVTLHDDGTDVVSTYKISVLDQEAASTADTVVSGDTGDDDSGVTLTEGDDSADEDGGVTPQSLHVDGLVTPGGSLTTAPVASRVLVNGRSMSRTRGLVSASSGALVGTNLNYEGSCAFLRGCSVPSHGAAAGTVRWGCGGTTCVDSEHWMAVPAAHRSLCGKTITVCKGTNCQTALVRDISNAARFEGSQGLLGALGLPYGGQCVNGRVTGGYGGGMVKVKY